MPEDLAYREYGSKPIQERQKRTSSVEERARAPAADRLYLQFPLLLHSVPLRVNPLTRELARAFSVPKQHEGHSRWVYPEYEAKRYAGLVKGGGILLSVHCDNLGPNNLGQNLEPQGLSFHERLLLTPLSPWLWSASFCFVRKDGGHMGL